MIPNSSKFIIRRESSRKPKYWANYADENILLVTHDKVKPYVDLTEPVMQYLSSAAPSLVDKRTPLQDWLQGSGRVREVDSDYVKWKLKGTGEIQAIALENINPGVPYPGIGHSEFAIKLDFEHYVPGDVLAPDIAKDCQVVVQGSEPIRDGDGFIYNVEMVNRNFDAYFDPALLEKGINWIKIDSVYGEGSEGYGSTIFGGVSYIVFQTELTDYGKTFEVTNKAHDMQLRVSMCDTKGAPMEGYPDQIISYMEAEFLKQARWEKELRLFYGRSAGKQIDDYTIGNHRRIGPGLLEFLEDGNVIKYAIKGFSLDMFESFLTEIWFDRVEPGQRNVVVYTGQAGLQQIQEAIAEKYAGSSIQTDFNTFVGSGKSYDPSNYSGLSFQTAYFTEIKLFPFGSIRFEHWPILDSRWLNPVKHPESGLPLSSYEYIVLDYGLGNGGGSNIELLRRRGSQAHTYVCGTWGPRGAINEMSGGSQFIATGPQRRYQLFHTDTHGIRVKDVTLTAHFVPNVQ